MTALLTESKIDGLKLLRRGKVRDVYDLGDKLLMVSTDRLSAFDCILPNAIPGKGKLLTQISALWFERTKHLVPNHMITADFAEIAKLLPRGADAAEYDGRTMLVKKAQRVDAECVARAYLAGSAWKEYRATGRYLDHELPPGLSESSKLPRPIFTPATKADEGHDENITRERLAHQAGKEIAEQLQQLTLALFAFASERLMGKSVILADTKFEFGFIDGKLCVIDEMITPDSSRVWSADTYKPGASPESFDKQFVRDYLERVKWNKQPPAPTLPQDVVDGTVSRYREFLDIVRSA